MNWNDTEKIHFYCGKELLSCDGRCINLHMWSGVSYAVFILVMDSTWYRLVALTASCPLVGFAVSISSLLFAAKIISDFSNCVTDAFLLSYACINRYDALDKTLVPETFVWEKTVPKNCCRCWHWDNSYRFGSGSSMFRVSYYILLVLFKICKSRFVSSLALFLVLIWISGFRGRWLQWCWLTKSMATKRRSKLWYPSFWVLPLLL